MAKRTGKTLSPGSVETATSLDIINKSSLGGYFEVHLNIVLFKHSLGLSKLWA
jgi:hypothetical protein